MRLLLKPIVALASLLIAGCLGGASAGAQTIHIPVVDIALKSGETTELGNVWMITMECRSILTATPEVEVMEGPPGVTVEIKQAMVVPRAYSCANPVAGGKLMISAANIEEYSYSRMVFRVTYKTRSGDRQRSQHVNVALFPKSN
jgi:hypothetical protein